MSAILSRIAEFFDRIERSGLVPSGTVAKYRSRAEEFASPADLAARMVQEKVLTKFQAEQFLAGRSKLTIGGRYHVRDRLGGGGMGRVFLCQHAVMGHLVAIKILNSEHREDDRSRERFRREARAVASLNHPNVVRALEMDQDGSHPFLVMEYVPGETVHVRTLRSGRLKPAEAAAIAYQSALGLEHAREAGLVHRDIKPANLLVDRTGCVKILDLGLALFTEEELKTITRGGDGGAQILGTADYLAPEQALDSHSVDTRADVYSLGATLYFMLSGSPPFPAKNLAEKFLAQQVREPAPLPADVPPGLCEIVRKMMAKRPQERYQTPGEVADALRPWSGMPTASGRIAISPPVVGINTDPPSGITDIGGPPTPSVSERETVPIRKEVAPIPEPEPTSEYVRHRRQAHHFPWRVTLVGVIVFLVGVGLLLAILDPWGRPATRPEPTEPQASPRNRGGTPPTQRTVPVPEQVPYWVTSELVRWEFTEGKSDDLSATPVVTSPKFRATALTRGPGLTTSHDSRYGSFLGVPKEAGKIARTFAEAITSEQYFEFTITPEPGTTLEIDSLECNAYFERFTGKAGDPRGIGMSAIGDPKFPIPLIFVGVGPLGTNPAGSAPMLIANDTPALRSITGPLTLRVFLWGAEPGEVYGLGGNGPDLVVVGTIRPTVTPAAEAAAAVLSPARLTGYTGTPNRDYLQIADQFAGLSPDEQIREFSTLLRKRNPNAVNSPPQLTANAQGQIESLTLLTPDVTDIAPIAGLRNLGLLSAAGDRSPEQPRAGSLRNLAPLAGLPLRNVELTHNPSIEDLSPLSGAPLMNVDVSATKVRDLRPVAQPKLTTVDASGTRIRHLDPLKDLPISLLKISNSPVQDLSAIQDLPLKTLAVGGAYPMRSWEPIRSCKTLKSLSITASTPQYSPDLSVAKDLPNLTRLHLGGVGIRDLSPLSGVALRSFVLSGTSVTDLTPLRNMPLTEFVAVQGVPDLSPLVDVPIRVIRLEGDLRPHAAMLRKCRTLQSINGRPAAEVLRELDAPAPK